MEIGGKREVGRFAGGAFNKAVEHNAGAGEGVHRAAVVAAVDGEDHQQRIHADLLADGIADRGKQNNGARAGAEVAPHHGDDHKDDGHQRDLVLEGVKHLCAHQVEGLVLTREAVEHGARNEEEHPVVRPVVVNVCDRLVHAERADQECAGHSRQTEVDVFPEAQCDRDHDRNQAEHQNSIRTHIPSQIILRSPCGHGDRTVLLSALFL